jgi:transcriptional regulator with XRE-family HTH domain
LESIEGYIRKLREEKGYGLKTLSQLMGYKDHTYIQQIERGKTRPSDEFLKQFGDILKLTKQERGMLMYLRSLRKYDPQENLTEAEIELKKLLEQTGIVVGAYTGKLSEDEIRQLIRDIKGLQYGMD